MVYSYQMQPLAYGRYYDPGFGAEDINNYGAVVQPMPIPVQQMPVPQMPVVQQQEPNTQIYTYPQSSVYIPKSKALQNSVAGAGVGAVAGVGLGLVAKPHIANKTFSENFAKDIAKKYIEQDACEFNNIYKDGNMFLKEVKNVKNGAEFVNLLEKCNLKGDLIDVTPETEATLRAIEKPKDLKRHISSYSKHVENRTQEYINVLEENICSCWNETDKKFVKPDTVTDDLFNFVKKSKNKLKGKTLVKGACIGAAVAGVGTYLLTKAAEKSYAKRMS